MKEQINIPHMLLAKQVAEQSGIPIYRIRQWVKENKIVYVKCGKKILINYDRFVEFLDKGEVS